MSLSRRHLLTVAAVALGVILVFFAALDLHSGAASPTAEPTQAAAPQTAANRFATAYARELDGAGAARALPYSTPAVGRTAASLQIPAHARSGELAIVALRLGAPRDGRVSVHATARDRAHTFPFDFALLQLQGGWVVNGLIPPDVGEVLASHTSYRYSAPPGARAAVARVALAYERQRGHPRARIMGLAFSPLQEGTLPVTVRMAQASRSSLVYILARTHGGWRLDTVWHP